MRWKHVYLVKSRKYLWFMWLGDSILFSEFLRLYAYAQQQIAMKSRPPRILGSHSQLRNWMLVTRDKMLAFLGIVLSMGIIKMPTFESYWELNSRAWSFETPNFGYIMSRNRFQARPFYSFCIAVRLGSTRAWRGGIWPLAQNLADH